MSRNDIARRIAKLEGHAPKPSGIDWDRHHGTRRQDAADTFALLAGTGSAPRTGRVGKGWRGHTMRKTLAARLAKLEAASIPEKAPPPWHHSHILH